jgi:TfoX C-terminal domain.
MGKLTDLPNISKVIAGDLQKAGISTAEELKRIGSRAAFVLI